MFLVSVTHEFSTAQSFPYFWHPVFRYSPYVCAPWGQLWACLYPAFHCIPVKISVAAINCHSGSCIIMLLLCSFIAKQIPQSPDHEKFVSLQYTCQLFLESWSDDPSLRIVVGVIRLDNYYHIILYFSKDFEECITCIKVLNYGNSLEKSQVQRQIFIVIIYC